MTGAVDGIAIGLEKEAVRKILELGEIKRRGKLTNAAFSSRLVRCSSGLLFAMSTEGMGAAQWMEEQFN